jgi:hypothetical protein
MSSCNSPAYYRKKKTLLKQPQPASIVFSLSHVSSLLEFAGIQSIKPFTLQFASLQQDEGQSFQHK